MTTVYTLREAKARLSALLDRAAAGEAVEIVRGGARKGRFRILPSEAGGAVRRPGALRGRIAIPAEFDAEDEAIVAAFEGR